MPDYQAIRHLISLSATPSGILFRYDCGHIQTTKQVLQSHLPPPSDGLTHGSIDRLTLAAEIADFHQNLDSSGVYVKIGRHAAQLIVRHGSARYDAAL